jgi:hypothetical protein
MKNRHIRYTFDRKSFFGKAAIFCLILSMVLRGIGGLLNRTIFEDWFTIVEFGLPILCALLYLLSLLIFGRKWFKVTVFPFVLGVMACVVRLFSFDNLMQQEMSVERILVSVFFYLVVTALYSAIAFGGLRARILLFLLFLVPLGYHAVFEIYPTVVSGFGLNLSLILMELSVLAVIVAMIFVSLSLSSKPRVSPVDPESGKNVVPPLPGDRLDEKPPVVTTEAPAEKPSEPAPAEQQPVTEKPEPVIEKPEPADKKPEPAPASCESTPVSSWPAPAEKEDPDYDPFAPSSGPIKLTLNPDLGDLSDKGEDA